VLEVGGRYEGEWFGENSDDGRGKSSREAGGAGEILDKNLDDAR